MKFVNPLRNINKNRAHILVFPFLSIFLMFFYLIFYCRGENIPIVPGTISFDIITGCVIALLSLLYAGLFIYCKRLCSLQFVVWYVIFTAISFLMVMYQTYILNFFSLRPSSAFPGVSVSSKVFYIIIILFVAIIVSKIIYERFKFKNCSILLLLVLQLLSLLTSNVVVIICASCISIGALAASKRYCTAKNRVLFICGSLSVYLIITISYLPFNPIWSFSENYSYGISFKPLRSTMITEENGKYRIYRGTSIKIEPITDIKFDTVSVFRPYILSKYVGLRCKADDNKPAISFVTIDTLKMQLYPIAVFDSCAFFAADVSVFEELSRLRKSDNKLYKNTSDLYFAYLDYFSKQNEISHNALRNTCLLLQKELDRYITDSISTMRNVNDESTFMRNCSRHISLGVLNACGSDLLYNNDDLSAFKLFSLQFLLTFYDNQYIYQGTRENIIAGTDTINIMNLNKENNPMYWTKISSLCCALAAQYPAQNGICLINSATIKLKTARAEKLLTDIIKHMQNINDIQLDDIYAFTPSLVQYATNLQSCLFNLIKNNYLSDYNAYFSNRINDVSMIICMHKETISINKNLSKIYNKRFTENINQLNALKRSFESTLDSITGFYIDFGKKYSSLLEMLKAKETN